MSTMESRGHSLVHSDDRGSSPTARPNPSMLIIMVRQNSGQINRSSHRQTFPLDGCNDPSASMTSVPLIDDGIMGGLVDEDDIVRRNRWDAVHHHRVRCWPSTDRRFEITRASRAVRWRHDSATGSKSRQPEKDRVIRATVDAGFDEETPIETDRLDEVRWNTRLVDVPPFSTDDDDVVATATSKVAKP